jgi:hypothetical protein
MVEACMVKSVAGVLKEEQRVPCKAGHLLNQLDEASAQEFYVVIIKFLRVPLSNVELNLVEALHALSLLLLETHFELYQCLPVL